jgi:hypothetical protein
MRLRALLSAAALIGAAVLVPTDAHAVAADVTCTGTETVNYQPGLLLSSQQVHVAVNGILAPCVSSNPAVTAGTYLPAFSATLSCATLLSGLPGTRVFQWSDGKSSTFTYSRTLNSVGGQLTVTFTGTITAGEFAGDTAVEQVVFVTPNTLQCLAPPGLTSLGPGLVVLSIVQP